ncbi:MAG TPA: helix-turn-helix domain-containing protein [Pseudonocardia sp.]|jgi:DNA-binding HxlR family transcriptional regulator|nr:helix-turn-helix domain-containing protein [Pseudonocardia sp.]
MDDDPNEPACSIRRSLQIFGERWTLLILREISLGHHRFAGLRDNLRIPPNLLSARLRMLVAEGVLEQREYRDPGSRVRHGYYFTRAGRELRLLFVALQQWGDEYRPRPAGPSVQRRSRSSGRPVRAAIIDDRGTVVPLRDVSFVRSQP